MNKILAVARWEYMERLKSKAFLIGLFVTPLLMLVMPLMSTVFIAQEDKETRLIGIIDQTGVLAAEFSRRMEASYKLPNGQPNYIIRRLDATGGLDAAVAEANKDVASGQMEGYCVVRGIPPQDSIVEYRSKSVGDFALTSRIESTLREMLAERRAAALGLSPEVVSQLKPSVNVRMVKVTKGGGQEEVDFLKVFYGSLMFQMMLLLMIVTSGQMLVRSVIEEKSNRIVEVLVSSCSSTELMAGKVLGLSGLGFTQLGFWTLIGIAVSLQFGVAPVALGQALLLALYFILGYLLYSALFIAVGSPVTTEQAAQQVTTYLTMVLVIPIAFGIPAMKSPDAAWLRVLTYVPILTPSMMALRVPIQMPGVAEIITTILLMLISIILTMIAAGRIFRVAILSTGKSPSLGEVLRWVKTG